MRPGWRLVLPYLFLSVLWVGWFGYVISDSSRAISFADILIRQDSYERRSGLPSTSDAAHWVAYQSAQRTRQRIAEMAILAFPGWRRFSISFASGLPAVHVETTSPAEPLKAIWGSRRDCLQCMAHCSSSVFLSDRSGYREGLQ
jgi:hypothetical protein